MTNPKVYVGTYAKYNSGSIAGEWVDLADYTSKEDFLEYCTDMLRADEEDPELMFQDWEDIPEGLITESSISDLIWDYLEYTEDWDESKRSAFDVWVENGNYSFAKLKEIHSLITEFGESFMGEWDSEIAFAREDAESKEYYSKMDAAGVPRFYFDEEAFCRDIFINEYWYDDKTGFVFLRN